MLTPHSDGKCARWTDRGAVMTEEPYVCAAGVMFVCVFLSCYSL